MSANIFLPIKDSNNVTITSNWMPRMKMIIDFNITYRQSISSVNAGRPGTSEGGGGNILATSGFTGELE